MSDLSLDFDQPALIETLDTLDHAGLDRAAFGVIGFDAGGTVQRYNAVESHSTGLHPDKVIGQPLFTQIAQCMNNYLVAQRFEDATAAGEALDATIDFMLTWRMRPTPVRLRMLQHPAIATRYVLIQRLA